MERARTPFARAEGFRVEEGGEELRARVTYGEMGSLEAEWSFRAADERRTFDISYRVRCAVEVYDDAAHLLWQFVGTGWAVPTDHLVVRVRVPGRVPDPGPRPAPACGDRGVPEPDATVSLAGGEVRAWGHGPLGGEVTLPDPQTVVFEVRDLAPNTFVEGSILMPPEVVPLAPAYPGGPGRSRILAQERALAEEANERRAAYRRERAIAWGMLAGIPLALVALVLVSRLRDRVGGVPRLLEEPPENLHPVVLATLWDAASGRYLSRTAYRTQLLHLARIGAIDLNAVGRVTDPEDIVVRLRTRPKGALDEAFTRFLFPDSQRSVRLKEIDARGTRRKRLRSWNDAVKGKTGAMVDRVRKAGPRIESAAMLGIVAIALWWWGTVEFVDGLAAVAAGVALLGWIVGLRRMRPRLPSELRARVARWAAFRRYLRRFSSLPDAPAVAVVVWERYLVYATALGVADEVERQVRELVPPDDLPSPWRGAPGGLTGVHLAHAFHTTAPVHPPGSPITPAAASFSSGVGSFTSTGGFGGGFSGGGGAGGGGTGGGGR